MESLTSNGECPQCKLNGKIVSIVLNHLDYWECPDCKLQLQSIADIYLGILENRGSGALKYQPYNFEKWGERVLLRKPLCSGDNCIFQNTRELIEYLTSIK